MSSIDKMVDAIIDGCVTVKTISELVESKQIAFEAAVSSIRERVRETLLQRIDYNQEWLDFVTTFFPESYDSDNKLTSSLWNTAEAAYMEGYINGWQDREVLFNDPARLARERKEVIESET